MYQIENISLQIQFQVNAQLSKIVSSDNIAYIFGNKVIGFYRSQVNIRLYREITRRCMK